MNLRIAVLSDLHFASSEKGASYSHMVLTRDPVRKQHPYGDLLRLVDAEKLSADIVLCPGDITLQADTSALKAAWGHLNQLQAKLGGSHLIAATGNHDVSSRYKKQSKTNPEMWETLKQLSPRYPHPQGDRSQWLQYWALHYCIIEIQDVRVVSLNTCNSHARGAEEFERGRITDYTIGELEDQLKAQGPKALNILLCHHHPMKQPDLSERDLDYSEMVQGRKLIQRLENTGWNWMVIHGHKHCPRLEYAVGATTSAPVVLSAGSFSAVIPPTYISAGGNQFYIIEFDIDYIKANGLAGIVRAWDWVSGVGWQPSRFDPNELSKPMSESGFGHRVNIAHDAGRIADKFKDFDRLAWIELIAEFPWIKFVTRGDLEAILKRLKEAHGFEQNLIQGDVFPRELLRNV